MSDDTEPLGGNLPPLDLNDPAQLEALGRSCRKCGADNWSRRNDGTFCCKPCRSAYTARWYRRNRELVLTRQTERFEADPQSFRDYEARRRRENPAHIKAIQAKTYRKNASKIKARVAQWASKHPDSIRRYAAKWRKDNPVKKLAECERRRALKLSAPGRGISSVEWQFILDGTLGLCAYCNDRKPLTLDHIESLSWSGAHDPDNAAAVCGSCNSSKGNSHLLLWLAKRSHGRVAA